MLGESHIIMYYYVYILISLKDNNFYIGYTEDLGRRIKEHNLGKVKSTKYRKPFKLICCEAHINKIDALKREKYLKSSDGKKDLKKRLIKSLKNL
ncbi:GIY-YIG nuclease family protein [Patescibacteria group bacterium]